jgi:hypothetical protein
MISSSYNFYEFIEFIKDKEYLDIIYLAEREATEAERRLYHPRKTEEAVKKGVKLYAETLEGLIFFLRYGIKPRGLRDSDVELFGLLCEGFLEKKKIERATRTCIER